VRKSPPKSRDESRVFVDSVAPGIIPEVVEDEVDDVFVEEDGGQFELVEAMMESLLRIFRPLSSKLVEIRRAISGETVTASSRRSKWLRDYYNTWREVHNHWIH
jgi:hypothetical protein